MVFKPCGDEEVNNRGQHLEDLFIKNDLILFIHIFILQVVPSLP